MTRSPREVLAMLARADGDQGIRCRTEDGLLEITLSARELIWAIEMARENAEPATLAKLDRAVNGRGAAEQPSFCDLVGQWQAEQRALCELAKWCRDHRRLPPAAEAALQAREDDAEIGRMLTRKLQAEKEAQADD